MLVLLQGVFYTATFFRYFSRDIFNCRGIKLREYVNNLLLDLRVTGECSFCILAEIARTLVMLASGVAIAQLTSNASRRVVGQWGGAGGAGSEDSRRVHV